MRSRPPLLVVVVSAITVAFFAVPLFGLLTNVSWSTLTGDLTTPESLSALKLSLLVSFVSTTVSVIVGVPLAWLLANVAFPGRAFVRGLVIVPLVLPPVVGGLALLAAFSRTGLVGRYLYDWFGWQFTFTTTGTIIAATFVALPFFVITAESGFRSLDHRFDEAAATLGASSSYTLWRVTLPMVMPSIIAGAVLSWARALGEFGATITFAGNIVAKTQTMPLAVYLDLDLHPERAYALSLVLLAVSLTVIVALRGRIGGRL